MCHGYIDEYELMDELVYREALLLHRRGDLAGLRDLYIKAARMEVDHAVLEEIEELIEELEEKLFTKMRARVMIAQ